MKRDSRKLHTSMSPSVYKISFRFHFHHQSSDILFPLIFYSFIHRLECESGLYFNMQYFKEMLLLGKWEDAENYLSRFTRIDGNMHSTKIFFEIRKQKYLEALDK